MQVDKNIFLAHGKATQIIRKKAVLPPQVGIAMDGMFFIPWEETEQEIEKAKKECFPIRQTSVLATGGLIQS